MGKTKAPEERKEEKWRIAERGELEKEDDWRTRRRYGGRGGVDIATFQNLYLDPPFKITNIFQRRKF